MVSGGAFSGGGVRRKPVLPNGVLGILLFIGVEAMLFAGFFSAFTIVKANFAPGMWPPPGQPRFPAEATAVTTLILLVSGVLLWWSGRRFETEPASARGLLAASATLGATFIGIQGVEWARLIGEGLTLDQNPYGGLFYVIVGAHAAHAVPALIALVVMWVRMQRGYLDAVSFTVARAFWYFVVLVWPVLYWRVYL
jgi:heme/copper-type cytochrome/quinol oxidase subunit 3